MQFGKPEKCIMHILLTQVVGSLSVIWFVEPVKRDLVYAWPEPQRRQSTRIWEAKCR